MENQSSPEKPWFFYGDLMCILKGVSPDKRTKFRNVTKFRNISREHCKRIQFSCITRTGDRDALTCARRCWSGFGASCRVWGEGGDSMSKTRSKRL